MPPLWPRLPAWPGELPRPAMPPRWQAPCPCHGLSRLEGERAACRPASDPARLPRKPPRSPVAASSPLALGIHSAPAKAATAFLAPRPCQRGAWDGLPVRGKPPPRWHAAMLPRQGHWKPRGSPPPCWPRNPPRMGRGAHGLPGWPLPPHGLPGAAGLPGGSWPGPHAASTPGRPGKLGGLMLPARPEGSAGERPAWISAAPAWETVRKIPKPFGKGI